jgi:DNA-binding GntR family transcriptional regulator
MAEFALEQLREAIIMGELPAGTPLRLDELARSLGMSISPIREAVRQLEALGLAKHVPHQGARVLDFDVEELRDLFQVRLALESLAVRRATQTRTRPARSSSDSTRPPPSTTSGSRCGRTRTSTSRCTTRRSRRGSWR